MVRRTVWCDSRGYHQPGTSTIHTDTWPVSAAQYRDKGGENNKQKCVFWQEGCKERFKTKQDMMIHRESCNFHYSTTKKYEVEKITAVFGKSELKLYKVRWKYYPDPDEDTWETEKMLWEDGCREAIEDFWDHTQKYRTLDFYKDEEGRNRCWIWCGWCCKKNNE